jgi:hypothetical protein
MGTIKYLIGYCILRNKIQYSTSGGDRPGRDRMVVGFTTTYAISVYHQ